MGVSVSIHRHVPELPAPAFSHYQDASYAPLLRAYGQTPLWLVAHEGGRNVGVWLLFETPGNYLQPPSGRLRQWLDVHMFAIHGPVLATNLNDGERRAVIAHLLNALRRLAWRRWPISVSLLLDPAMPPGRMEEWRDLASSAGYKHLPKWTYLARLPDSEEALSAMVKADRRTKVRKAEKAGMTFACDCTEAALRAYYQVRAETLARNGHAPIAIEHFLDSYRAMEGTGAFKIFLASRGDRVGAGQLAYVHNGYVHLTGVSIADWSIGENIPANDFLQWNILRWALTQGCHSVDFVGAAPETTDPKLQAIDQFKARWGTELLPTLELRLRTPPVRRLALRLLDWLAGKGMPV